jgi:hypothetical protein
MVILQKKEDSSFRDSAGFVFTVSNEYFRQVNFSYKEDYDLLMSSGLYDELVNTNRLLAHEETLQITPINVLECYKILYPKQISLITYPYCWSFSMLKDAALLTLSIEKTAIEYGMTLKDASVYNVQFIGAQPIFIDTLSFEHYTEREAWIAYGQFCRHFLAPLALMAKKDVSLNKLLMVNIDGIPLTLTSKLLPLNSYLSIGLLLHIHLHAKSVEHFNDKKTSDATKPFSKKSMLQLIENLEDCIKNLKWQPRNTEWFDYYDKSVTSEYSKKKYQAVEHFLKKTSSTRIVDWGANDGKFSALAAEYASEVVSIDSDPACIELQYQRLKKNGVTRITPLIVDIMNPQPAIGWDNIERKHLLKRLNADTIMALALIHHLRVSNNTPLSMIAYFFSKYCQNLIIEFVPKSDDKVITLLQNRKDIFEDYTLAGFLAAFSEYFNVLEQVALNPTDRILFLMEKRT